MRGKLIVFEGIDGSGKETQAKELAEHLFQNEGKLARTFSFPRYNNGFFGKLLREALDGKCGNFVELDPRIASTLYAADRWESKEEILEWLNSGRPAICDRWGSSNQIHQGGKIIDVTERVEFLKWLDELEYSVYGLPKPDVTVFLDVPLEVSIANLAKKKRDTAENNQSYLENSLSTARWLASRNPDTWEWVVCADHTTNVMRPREEIAQFVLARLQARGVL